MMGREKLGGDRRRPGTGRGGPRPYIELADSFRRRVGQAKAEKAYRHEASRATFV